MNDGKSSLPSIEEVYGDPPRPIAEGKARRTAHEEAAGRTKEPWLLVVFRPGPEVASVLCRFADQRQGRGHRASLRSPQYPRLGRLNSAFVRLQNRGAVRSRTNAELKVSQEAIAAISRPAERWPAALSITPLEETS